MKRYNHFLRPAKRNDNGYILRHLMGMPRTDGQVGLEIEVEGNKFQKSGLPDPWSYHNDGSLRGNDNAEYVLQSPIQFDKVEKALKILWDVFDKYGSVLDESNRTSVHVHVNVQDFHVNRLAAFLGLYFSVEDILTNWCGEYRVGNLFCLRAKDATAIITYACDMIKNECCMPLPNGLHYSGLNLGAIPKMGSVEIRTLRGVKDPKIILDWVEIIERLYNLSDDFKDDPRRITGMFSSSGPFEYLSFILGSKHSTVMDVLNMTPDAVRSSLYEGIRLAQEICYSRDWSKYKTVELKDDPFGRAPKKPKSPSPQNIPHVPAGMTYSQYLSAFQQATQTGATISIDDFIEYGPAPTYDDIDQEF